MLRRQGLTLQEIGNMYGLTRERVRQIIVAYNKTAPIKDRILSFNAGHRANLTFPKKDEVKALLEEGKSFDEITLKLGITAVNLRRMLALLRKEGYKYSKSRKNAKIDPVLAKRMRAAGATLQTIADRFDAKAPSVHELLGRQAKK